jgi:hypothetical protein
MPGGICFSHALLMRYEGSADMSRSTIRQAPKSPVENSDFVLDDEQIMIALRDLAVMHQTDLSAWTYGLTEEEIIFTNSRLGETRWQLCKVLRAAPPQAPFSDKPDIRVTNEGSLVTFEPLNAKAAAFMNDALADAPVFNNAAVIEDRYASEVAAMLERNGFVLERINDA